MKIDQVNMHHLRMRLKNSFETSFGRIDTRDCILVEVFSDGLIGYGECVADHHPGYSSETAGTAWHILKEFLIPDILISEATHPSELTHRFQHIRGNLMAKAGLEMAVWDLYGKQTGSSLQKLLGGDGSSVKVGVSVGIHATPDELLSTVSDYVHQGYRRIKIKIKPGRDIGDVSVIRGEFPDIMLQVDANSAYSLNESDRLIELDHFGLVLIEQPLAEDDLWDHHKLQRKLRTPVCLDESILSVRHARQAIDMDACKIINIKAGRVGGLNEARTIHNLCHQNGIPVWCGGMLETGVGRAANLALASLPNFLLPGDISATERYYAEDITEETFTLNPDSTIDIPDQPGLGISINQNTLEKFTIKSTSIRA